MYCDRYRMCVCVCVCVCAQARGQDNSRTRTQNGMKFSGEVAHIIRKVEFDFGGCVLNIRVSRILFARIKLM